MTAKQTQWAHGAILIANLMFGINFTLVKMISPDYISAFGLNLVRASCTVALFWLFWLMKPRQPGIDVKDLPRFILCAITGITVNQLLFIKGLTLTTPIHAALLMLVTPVFILLISVAFKTEKMTILKATGLFLGIGGAGILISGRDAGLAGDDILLGDILVILNAISYAFYYVSVKPLMKKYKPIHVIRWVFSMGLLLMLPFTLGDFLETNWQAFQMKQYLSMAVVVIGGTFIAYLFTVYGLQHLSASAAGAYIYLQPVFASIISMLFFNETLNVYKMIAAVLIFVGVYLVNKNVRPASEM
ncbi:MAG: DMT family transporter [Chitinophagaceae bacterium]